VLGQDDLFPSNIFTAFAYVRFLWLLRQTNGRFGVGDGGLRTPPQMAIQFVSPSIQNCLILEINEFNFGVADVLSEAEHP
jgi:hypothetical protein